MTDGMKWFVILIISFLAIFTAVNIAIGAQPEHKPQSYGTLNNRQRKAIREVENCRDIDLDLGYLFSNEDSKKISYIRFYC